MHKPIKSRLASLLAALLVLSLARVASSANPFDEPTTALLVEAVESAFELDLYNDRCRSDRSGRHTDNLNKLLASKLRITVLGVLDDLFPEGSYRRSQTRIQTDFLAKLQGIGGCEGAKADGLRVQLRERSDDTLTRIGALP